MFTWALSHATKSPIVDDWCKDDDDYCFYIFVWIILFHPMKFHRTSADLARWYCNEDTYELSINVRCRHTLACQWLIRVEWNGNVSACRCISLKIGRTEKERGKNGDHHYTTPHVTTSSREWMKRDSTVEEFFLSSNVDITEENKKIRQND